MFTSERRRRTVRKLTVTAAALAVCVLPTACDYPLASPPGAPTAPAGGTPGSGDTTSPVVVPVGNTTDASASSSSSRFRDRDRRDRDRRDRTRTRTPRPTTAPVTTSPGAPTVVVPPGTETTDPATTDPATTTTDSGTAAPPTDTTTTAAPPTSAPPATISPDDILGRTCQDGANANLPAHTGFQSADAQCVSTQMGAVAAENQLPSLLITAAPTEVGVGQPFMLEVSTRNLVRDRFLGAAAGGYYLESSFLSDGGLQRGHFHTACRMLNSTTAAPDSAPAPAFFLATQDNKGGAGADTVTIEVPATATKDAGTMQCSSWAGDGSHRTPMMSRANQTPAFDSVRIKIAGSAPAVQNNVSEADAQADAQQQATAEQQQAGQAPDQDGATQLEGQQTAPAAPTSESTAPAAESPAASSSAAASSSSAAPDAQQSLSDRFAELRKEREAAGN